MPYPSALMYPKYILRSYLGSTRYETVSLHLHLETPWNPNECGALLTIEQGIPEIEVYQTRKESWITGITPAQNKIVDQPAIQLFQKFHGAATTSPLSSEIQIATQKITADLGSSLLTFTFSTMNSFRRPAFTFSSRPAKKGWCEGLWEMAPE